MQIAPTSVRVTWTTYPEVSGTRYRVRYSFYGRRENFTDIIHSTSQEISGLTIGWTYTFSVEAIVSNRLPSLSQEMNITLSEL